MNDISPTRLPDNPPTAPDGTKNLPSGAKTRQNAPNGPIFFHQAHPPTPKTTSALSRRPHERFRHLFALFNDTKTTSVPSHRPRGQFYCRFALPIATKTTSTLTHRLPDRPSPRQAAA